MRVIYKSPLIDFMYIDDLREFSAAVRPRRTMAVCKDVLSTRQAPFRAAAERPRKQGEGLERSRCRTGELSLMSMLAQELHQSGLLLGSTRTHAWRKVDVKPLPLAVAPLHIVARVDSARSRHERQLALTTPTATNEYRSRNGQQKKTHAK